MVLDILKILTAIAVGASFIPAYLATSHRIVYGNWHWIRGR